jgi:hypothetical protein
MFFFLSFFFPGLCSLYILFLISNWSQGEGEGEIHGFCVAFILLKLHPNLYFMVGV